MSRRNFCQACSFIRNGVKTRIAIDHTCDGANIPKPPPRQQYIPTREELDKYLAKLKELMEPDVTLPENSMQNQRRIRLDLMNRSEKSIQEAIWQVEKAEIKSEHGPELTEVVILLGKAKDKLSDIFDKQEAP